MWLNWTPELAKIIAAGIHTYEPHHGLRGAQTIFRGSYDWHSCVMGWWCLLGMQKQGFAVDLEVSATMLPSHFAREWAHLQANPEFELPYGRGWFFVLLSELANAETNETRHEVRQDLFAWLKRAPMPENDDRILGTHKSWLGGFFFAVLGSAIAGDEDALSELETLYEQKLQPLSHRLILFDQLIDGTEWDFIDRPALLAVIQLLLRKNIDPLLRQQCIENAEKFVVSGFPTLGREQAHVPGRVAMLTWPLLMLASVDDRCQVVSAEILAMIRNESECWKGNFHWFSHWVPQYIWIGRYLETFKS